MKLIHELRNLGVCPVLDADGAVALDVPDNVDLPAAMIERLRNEKAALLTELQEERDAIGTLITMGHCCHDVFPEESRRMVVALRQWQMGDLTDRLALWQEARPLVDRLHFEKPLQGDALLAELREVFPSRFQAVFADPTPKAIVVDMDAFAPAA